MRELFLPKAAHVTIRLQMQLRPLTDHCGPTLAVASNRRYSVSELSPAVTSISTEKVIPCLKTINPIPQVNKPKRFGRKNQTAGVLSASQTKKAMP